MSEIQSYEEKQKREKAERVEWLASLKIGDKVAGRSRHVGWIIFTIERLTSTQIIMARGAKYRRDTGARMGSNDSQPWMIDPITQEIKDSLALRSLAGWLCDVSRNPPSLAVLRAMKAAHDAAVTAEHGMVEVTQ